MKSRPQARDLANFWFPFASAGLQKPFQWIAVLYTFATGLSRIDQATDWWIGPFQPVCRRFALTLVRRASVPA